MSLPEFPFDGISLESFATAFRAGRLRSRDVTQAILARIDALEPRLAAYSYIDHEGALTRASAVDAMQAAGIDLGPLMGVPIALKDLYSVRGMPTNAGSRVDVSDLVPPQGPFVTALERAGCVILGKTVTTEFAMGGINLTHRLPWNPCDPETARMTGGSSHGSAVAMAAGMAAITFGSDTGGSVRWPAALCGVVGYKTSPGHWPVEGVFPLSKSMDSLGVFTRSAADAAFVEAAMREKTARVRRRSIGSCSAFRPNITLTISIAMYERASTKHRRACARAAHASCLFQFPSRASTTCCSRTCCLQNGLRFSAASASLPTRNTWIR